jgi:hypothetical protein
MNRILILSIIFTVLFSCEMPIDGVRQGSYSISFSKKNGLLINEYELLSDSTLYPNNKVVEAWNEYSWEYEYKNMKAEIVKDGFTAFYIKMTDDKDDLISFTDSINSSSGGVGVSSDKLRINLGSKPDTIRLFYKNDNENIPMLFVKK